MRSPRPRRNEAKDWKAIGIHRFENGKIVETCAEWDNMAALAQLGQLPPPPQGAIKP